MPSLIEKLRRRRSRASPPSHGSSAVVDGSEVAELRPPEFRLFRQSTQDPEPLQVEIPSGPLQNLTIDTNATNPLAPSSMNTQLPKTPTSQIGNPLDSINPSSTSQSGVSPTPPRSGEKRMSQRLLRSLSRRPSQMSTRSRSSSYLPDFSPIDNSANVEAQWEQRATMLARAGPPSPAIPRTDSIFDTGPPRLPPVTLESSQAISLQSSTIRVVSSPERLDASCPARGSHLPRNGSHGSRLNVEVSASSSVAVVGDFARDGETTDDVLQLAIREHEKGNLVIATQLFKKSAQGEDGLPLGQLMYGLSLRHGWGIERDEARAIHWLRLAASSSAAVEEIALSSGISEGGHMKGDLILAIFELGNCFRHGWGVAVDKDLARNYYETAANLGDGDAMYEVAWCYETGFGIKKDKYKAAYWYRKNEKNGNKIPGMQWIWKPKYDHDPFAAAVLDRKGKVVKSK